MKEKYIIPAVILSSLVFGAGGFIVGKNSVKSVDFPNYRQLGGDRQFGQMARNGQMMKFGTRPIVGQIIDADDKSITINTTDGGSKIVWLNESVRLGKVLKANVSELVVGASVSTEGKINDDGSITADSINLLDVSEK